MLSKDGFTVASLEPVVKGDWLFKVSANNYENGVLIFAANYLVGYTTCRYFSSDSEARTWIDTLASYTNEILFRELDSLKSDHLKKPAK